MADESKPSLLGTHGLTIAYVAERMIEAFGETLRYDHLLTTFLIFEGHRWVPDVAGRVWRMVIEVARSLYDEFLSIADSHDRDKALSFAKHLQSASGIRAVLSIVRNLPPVAVSARVWDLDPMLIGLPNGVMDLRSGILRPGKPEDMITRSAAVGFDPSASCKRWKLFLAQVFGSGHMIRYIKRVFGYCLTGRTDAHIWWLLAGAGSNGKSTLINTVAYVLGEYALTMPFSVVELPIRSSVPDDVAALVSRRLVAASETVEGARLNEARIKALTGGDTITARHLFGRYFEYKPALKLFLSANHKPTVRDDTFGFWRRVHVVEFKYQFEGPRRDDRLTEALRAEATGIMRWMVEGCGEWQEIGLAPPESVLRATASYQRESDVLTEFLAERCKERPEGSVGATKLYKAYRMWLEGAPGRKERLSQAAFGTRMSKRFHRVHTRDGDVYQGVELAGASLGSFV